tara:strand:+ start:2047 stop:2292 length:246 start_codon:yes stop_codon:yes gene_type:complete
LRGINDRVKKKTGVENNMGTTIELTYTVEIAEEDIEYMKYADLTILEWLSSRVYVSGVDMGIGEGQLTHLPVIITDDACEA